MVGSADRSRDASAGVSCSNSVMASAPGSHQQDRWHRRTIPRTTLATDWIVAGGTVDIVRRRRDHAANSATASPGRSCWMWWPHSWPRKTSHHGRAAHTGGTAMPGTARSRRCSLRIASTSRRSRRRQVSGEGLRSHPGFDEGQWCGRARRTSCPRRPGVAAPGHFVGRGEDPVASLDALVERRRTSATAGRTWAVRSSASRQRW